MTKDEALSEPPCKTGSQCTSKCQQCDLPAQRLPFGVGGGLVAIKTLLSRDPCAHAKTAIEMIDAMLAEQPAPVPEAHKQQEPVAWGVDWGKAGDQSCVSIIKRLSGGGIEVLATEYGPPASKPWVG